MSPVPSWTVHLGPEAGGLAVSVPPTMNSLTTFVLLEQERWFEPEMSLLPRLLEPGMQVLDIGANHGLVALAMARCVAGTAAGRDGHVWAFEPTSTPRARMQRSLAANGLQEVVTVVPAALAEADGEASFAVHDNSELNSREGAGAVRETVALRTLDGCLAELAPGARIDFIKLDAEGDELRVLEGARHFFATQSPVVMFEFMHGKTVSGSLIAAWTALGYGLFRWSAELGLLMPFDFAHTELAFALNLLAVRPSAQEALAARGLLVTAAARDATAAPEVATLDPAALQAWCASPALAGLPCSTSTDPEDIFMRGLRALAAAHFDTTLPAAQRLALVQQVHDELQAAGEAGASLGPAAWSLLVHAQHALGAQHASVQLAALVLSRWPQGLDLDGVVVPPTRGDLARPRTTTPGSWLRQMLAEHVERHCTHSSYFRIPPLPRLAALLEHPDHGAEIERRWLLAHALQNRSAPLARVRLLPDARHTSNPVLWQGLLAAMAPAGTPPASRQSAALAA